MTTQAEDLAARYSVPLEAVQRGLEACDRAGMPVAHYERRYLIGDRREPMSIALQVAMRDVQRETRDARQPIRVGRA